jgi:hypothetical protein
MLVTGGDDNGALKVFQNVDLAVSAVSSYSNWGTEYTSQITKYQGIQTWTAATAGEPQNGSYAGPVGPGWVHGSGYQLPQTIVGGSGPWSAQHWVQDSDSLTILTNTNTTFQAAETINGRWLNNSDNSLFTSWTITYSVSLTNGTLLVSDYTSLLGSLYRSGLSAITNHTLIDGNFLQPFDSAIPAAVTLKDDGTTLTIQLPTNAGQQLAILGSGLWGWAQIGALTANEVYGITGLDIHVGEDSSGLAYTITKKVFSLLSDIASSSSNTNYTSKQWWTLAQIGEPDFDGGGNAIRNQYQLNSAYTGPASYIPLYNLPPPDANSLGQKGGVNGV